MNTRTRNTLSSLAIGLAAGTLVLFIQNQSVIPSTLYDFVSLAIIVAAVLAGSLLAISPPTAVVVTGSAETGTVKWFNIKKGYGFITRDQGDDVFVHYRNIQGGQGRKAIAEGQRVRFVVVTGDKGLQAEEVEAL